MMQVKKDKIKNRILEAAKEEFKEKSYEKASMRKIAKKADVTTSNIYNYFENKDDIFTTILQPLINKIEAGKEALVKFEYNRDEYSWQDLIEHQEIVVKSAQFINENRERLKILVFNAEGSSLENYTDELVTWYTEKFKEHLSGKEQSKFDHFFFRITTSLWVNTIREALLKDIKGNQLIRNAKDVMTFVYHGWYGIVKTKGIDIEGTFF